MLLAGKGVVLSGVGPGLGVELAAELRELGQVDALIHNADLFGHHGPFEETRAGHWRAITGAILDVNAGEWMP